MIRRVVLEDGTPLLVIRNDAVHLGPFFGALWTPNERLFSHGFLQCDVASVGNTVTGQSRWLAPVRSGPPERCHAC